VKKNKLDATAAIEYVAACCVTGAGGFFSGGAFVRGYFARGTFLRGSFARGHFWPGGLLAEGFLSGGAFVRGVFCPRGLLSGGLMPVPPKFNAYTHRVGFLCLASLRDGQTDILGPLAPRGVDPRSPNFQGI